MTLTIIFAILIGLKMTFYIRLSTNN